MKLHEFKPEGVTQSTGQILTHEQGKPEMFFRSYLTGMDGARYELFREKHHTPEDIQRAKRYLKNNFDCLTIEVIKET